MSAARFQARGGATGDGRVIVAAGRAASGLTVSTIELYDPSLNTWKTLPTPPTGILNASIYRADTSLSTGIFSPVFTP